MPPPKFTSAEDGWIRFAALALIIVGAFNVIHGLVALLQDDFFAVTKNDLLVTASYTTWGWTHLVLGLLLVGCGLAVGAGKTWGRMVALVILVFNIMAQFAFVPAAPVWSIVIMAFDVAIIYAITVHVEGSKALLS
jgi:hypothetical protein